MPVSERVKEISLRILPRPMLKFMKKRYYVNRLRRPGTGEETEMSVIRLLVAPGDSVIDIGANYGLYAMFLSGLVAENGLVHAIEPVPETCDILEYECRKLGKRNIRVIRSAISDEDGSVRMEVPRYDAGGENYYRAHILREAADPRLKSFDVVSRTLDSLFEDSGGRLTFIKCDTEGNEYKCLLGARQVIRKFRPALMIELGYDPRKNPSERKILDLLAGEGYGVYKLRRGRLARGYLERDEDINYFFLREEHAARAASLIDNR